MKVFIFIILFILVYNINISNESLINHNSCSNNICNSIKNNNNDLIINNIYVNKLGNDTSNNGTAEYPFYSICKVISFINENLNPSNQINVYIGPGEFDCSFCEAIFEGYIEINFYGINGLENNGIDGIDKVLYDIDGGNNGNSSGFNYINSFEKDNRNQQNYIGGDGDSSFSPNFENISYLKNMKLCIYNTNFLLSNVFTALDTVHSAFNTSNSSFKFQNSTFFFLASITANIDFRNSTIEFSGVHFNVDEQIFNTINIYNSRMLIKNSSLYNLEFYMYNNCTFLSENSFHFQEQISINFYSNDDFINIEYNNATILNINYYQNKGHHTLSFISSIVYFNKRFNGFSLVDSNTLNIIDTEIKSIGEIKTYSFINSLRSCVNIHNSSISSFWFPSEIILFYQSIGSIINTTFNNVYSDKYYFYLFDSQLILDSFEAPLFFPSSSFIYISSPSNVTINNISLQAQSRPIYMDLVYSDNSLKSVIDIKNSNFSSIKTFIFINSNVNFENIKIGNIQNNLNIPLFSFESSLVNFSSCVISGGGSLGSSYIFTLKENSRLNLDNTFIRDSSNLITASPNSTISILDSIFLNIFTKSSAISIGKYSNLYLKGVLFESIFCADQSFLDLSNSNIIFNDVYFTKFDTGPQPLIVLDSSIATFSNFTLLYSFFQNSIIYINNKSNLDIRFCSISSNSNNGEAIIVQDQSVLSITSCNFTSNIFSSFISLNYSSLDLKNVTSEENVGVFLSSKNNGYSRFKRFELKLNRMISSDYFFIIQDSKLDINIVEIIEATFINPLFKSTKSTINFNDFLIFRSTIALMERGSLFYFYDSNIQFENSNFLENDIKSIDNLFTAYYGRTSFIDSEISSNINYNENGGVIFLASNFSSLYIRDSLMEENQFQLGTIQIFNKSSISIINSTFSFNSNNGNGGVFYLDENSFVIDLLYSSFFNNSASVGGAIFSNFYFNYSSYFYLGNQFIGNKAIYGNNIASSPFQINIIFPDDNYTLDKNTNTNFQVLDIFNNLISNLNYVANIYINKLYVNSSITETLKPIIVKGGIGSFNYTYFAPESLLQFLVVINIPELNLTRGSYKDKSKCSNYQLYNTTTGVCSFCPPNQVALNGNCSECPSTLKCFNQEIFSITNYYLIINNSTNENSTNNFNSFDFKIYQCPPQICKSSNECYSSLANGNLCSRCLTDQQIDNYYKDISTFPSVSKNSLHCCSYFKPVLIIGFIFFIFSFGILLSLYKFNIRNSLITPIILMIQWNSIIFYSYKGFYIIPLFRLSIDYIENYCTFKINYLEKSIISIISTFIIFFIGTSNIGTVIIEYLLSIKRLPKQKLLKLIPKSIINNIKLSKKYRYNNNQLSSQWNIFLILLQPLLFITTSLIIPKKINNQQFLSIDISILYNYFITQWILLIFSFILLFIILIIIPIRFFIYHYKNNQISKLTINNKHSRYDNSSNNNNSNIDNSIYNRIIFQNISNHYRKGYKWWDLLFIFKSFSFSILSISMLYSSDFYLLSVTLIHLFYSYIQFILHPQKNNIIYKVENATNLCQLINLIIIDSNLYKSFPPELSFNIGTLITITSFINIIIITIMYIFRFKFKNK